MRLYSNQNWSMTIRKWKNITSQYSKKRPKTISVFLSDSKVNVNLKK